MIRSTFVSTQSNPSPAVVITGSSTGIGAACALELDRRGFQVFAGVRSEADGRRLQTQASAHLTPLLLDVTDERSIAAAASVVADATGQTGLAGLVNNAGVVVSGPLELLPLEELRKQLEINVIGQIAVTQAFLPRLRDARGRIVNMSSVNGAVSPPYLGPYAASKYALEALTEALRLELRPWGIAVSSIAPGAVATPIWDKSRKAADRLAESIAPERLQLYDSDLDIIRKLTERLAAAAIPVDRVVRAVVHALTARRPRVHYFIGFRTRLCFRGFKMVPDRIRDWLIRRALGLP